MPFLIRSASLTDYEPVARSLGLDPHQMLAQARIAPDALNETGVRLPGGRVGRLLETSAQLSGAEDFGLRMAERRELPNLGALGLLIREQGTLGAALECLARYVRFQNESLRVDLVRQESVVLVRMEFVVRKPTPLRQAIELSVAVQHRTMRTLVGRFWQPLQVSFRHAAPRELATHRRVFQPAQLQFSAEYDGISLRPADLARPLPGSDPDLARHTKAFLDGLSLDSKDPVLDRTKLMIRVLLPTGHCSADAVSRQLGIDRRTLHRHLQREQSSFGEALDAVRRELVPRYLEGSDRKLHDVAQMLGFSEASVLSRWFSGAFGCSLSEWRRAHSSR